MTDVAIVLVQIGIPFLLLLVGFFLGRLLERRHYRRIREREEQNVSTEMVSMRSAPLRGTVARTGLAMGSVVVSIDYYKRFLAGFRSIFGGEMKSYSTLIDRGRREAVLRMRESWPDADHFVNCRLETAAVFQGATKTTCVEIVAYGTAICYRS